jgi:hypothetical protein
MILGLIIIGLIIIILVLDIVLPLNQIAVQVSSFLIVLLGLILIIFASRIGNWSHKTTLGITSRLNKVFFKTKDNENEAEEKLFNYFVFSTLTGSTPSVILCRIVGVIIILLRIDELYSFFITHVF